MPIQTSIELNKFQAPNFATVKSKPGRKEDGLQPLASIPIAELEPKTLDELAFAWLEDIYEKAGHPNPFTIIRGR